MLPSPTSRRVFLARALGAAVAAGLTTSCKSPVASGGTVFANARRAGTLRVGIANEKPYGYIDGNGTLQGAMVELLKAVLAPYGITHVDAQIADFNALVPSLLAKRIDISAPECLYAPRAAATLRSPIPCRVLVDRSW